MSRAFSVTPFWRQTLLVGLGVASIYASLIPLAPGGDQVSPDLLYCLVVAWALRDPASAPLWIVLSLGLLADVMLSRPIGLGALGLVLASETARANAVHFRGTPFPVEWLAATLGFAIILVCIAAALRITFADAPGLMLNARYLLATALAYPLIALAIVRGVGVRLPRASPVRTLPGRLS